MFESNPSRLVCSLTVVSLMVLGCAEDGPPIGKVTGTVTLDGQPLENAIVSFVPKAGGRASVGTTNAQGKYQLSYVERVGALIGSHKVSITSPPKVESIDMSEIRSDDPRYAELMAKQNADYNNATVKESLPAVYNKESKLVSEVNSGNNTIDFVLTSDGKLP